MRRTWRTWTLAALVALGEGGCYSFHLVGPEDPPTVSPPGTVFVTVEYTQTGKCSSPTGCDDPVVFYASWMRPGGEFSLTPDPVARVWRGLAYGVPINFPPVGDPYQVHVLDPYLRGGSSAGMTALRLVVGGEAVGDVVAEGTPQAHGRVFVDANGHGRNTY
jgi:hypothetical protein